VTPQHLSKSDSWGTPSSVVELVHEFFGGPPDLDPASSPAHNRLVKARQILTRADDALQAAWPRGETVFLNPPGGKIGNRSVAGLFWARFVDQFLDERFDVGVFLGFTLEILRTAQDYHTIVPLDCPICVPRQRLRFLEPVKGEGGSPTHANAIILLTRNSDLERRFVEVFGRLGSVIVPA